MELMNVDYFSAITDMWSSVGMGIVKVLTVLLLLLILLIDSVTVFLSVLFVLCIYMTN